jgi:hypothetical protein
MHLVRLCIALVIISFNCTAFAEETSSLSLKSRAANYLGLKPQMDLKDSYSNTRFKAKVGSRFTLNSPTHNRLFKAGDMEVIRKITLDGSGTEIKADAFEVGIHIALSYQFI